eukprot:NODE_43_length_3237_cov_15.831556_g34_i0.p1 GENE.NODE_43_length_3237_cov_15.831556_g34_i0~~NODE_43_length_3237_cov_15.831556_g34_i0.p1  ORF type:complete len:1042 (+),score=386.07 NODE_43_length_3237_cov_15.831556_g34_i0:156-3128(+)
MGGSDRAVTLWTRDGVRLTTIATMDNWVWSVAQKPKQNFVAVGTNDGVIAVYQLIFSTVHGLYQDQYAYRDFMTDVVIDQLVTEKKLRIRCKDYVRKIAIYKDRLAVQLPDRIIIYELFHDDNYEMKHRVKERIQKKLDCNLLVVTSHHIVLCLEKRLQLFSFQGVKMREWVLESVIRYIKVVGGPPEREALLVGLKNGHVFKIFIDNPFPIKLIELEHPVRCLDLSASRMKLAVVDDRANCLVFHLKGKKELIFQEAHANSIAWNTEYENMLCFSGNGVLNIKTGSFPVHTQKLQGFVVGFKGSKIFTLHFVKMHTVDVPQSASMYRYLEKRDFDDAYKIACLGVTENDWRTLAIQALSHLKFEIARKSFIRIRDVRYIDLLNRIEIERRDPNAVDDLFLAEIYAYQGRFTEAAKLFVKCKREDKAIELYSDLKMWPEAKDLCSSDEKLKELIRRQARWAEETGEWHEAALTWVTSGDYLRAIIIMGDRGWMENLIEVCRTLPKTETQCIILCAQYFRKHGIHPYAEEAYFKVGDTKSLVSLHVEFQKWDEAFKVLETHPEYTTEVYLPYAEWLALNDKFDDAQEAFKVAKRPNDALRMLEQLAMNGITERRFQDGAFYLWKLAIENLRVVKEEEEAVQKKRAEREAAGEKAPENELGGLGLSDESLQRCAKFQEYYRRAEWYYAYHFIHRYTEVPFTSMDPLYLFHVSRFLLMQFAGNKHLEVPVGIRRLNILLALAKLGKQLETFKLAAFAYDKLQSFVVPKHMIDALDLSAVAIRAKTYADKDDMLPVCYRCSFTNPLLNQNGDLCANCFHPFIRSFHSFDHLPLVEFRLKKGFTHEEAETILDSGVMGVRGYRPKDSDWQEAHRDDDQNILTFNNEEMAHDMIDSEINVTDPFQRQLMALEYNQMGKGYQPVFVDSAMLKSMKRDEVYVVRWPTKGVPPVYYRNMIPDVLLWHCEECNHFFHEEDYEFEALKKGGCPFCGRKYDP